uniref:Uncharacterized protein n=1 Tax=Lepeophtheirus salmonis TaxID=72036 RepID=A0A0K2U6L3_LEPSM
MKVQSIISVFFLCALVLSSVPETEGFFLGNYWCNVYAPSQCTTPGRVFTVTITYWFFTKRITCQCPGATTAPPTKG